MELSFATCQAHNTVPPARGLAKYLTDQLPFAVRFEETLPWDKAYEALRAGSLDMAWICGRPYVELVDTRQAPLELLAAPVMAGERYQDRPVYFSDVIVHHDSPYQQFEDLRGVSWACNEPGSQSGYHITRYHLASIGEGGDYFGNVCFTGGHVNSIRQVLSGETEASAIDSTVLDWELAHDTALSRKIRVVTALGPSPIPPIVISTAVSAEFRDAIRETMLAMSHTAEGRAVLVSGALSRFAAVSDHDYDAIRRMKDTSANIVLQ